MKKLLLALIASLALCGTAVAQQGQPITTITFPAFVAGSPNMATPPTGAEILPIIQSGNTRKITLGQITTPVTVQPGSPVTYQPWMNVGNSPPAFEIWDGAQYVTAWTLNSSTHAIAFSSSGITNGLGYTPLNRAGDTMTGELSTSPSSGSSAGFNLGQGSSPSSPTNGDFWITSVGAFYRAGGATVGPLIGSGGSAVTSVFGRTGAVVAQTGDYTPTQVGLGNVTNDTQTKAAIVPNTAPSAGQILAGNSGGTAYAPVTMSGDATLASSGAISVSKSGGVAFGTAAFVNTGTSGATLGLLNGNLTFGGANAYGTPASITLTNGTGLPVSTGIAGLGTGVATALGNAVNGSGGLAPVGSPTFTGTVTLPGGGTLTSSADNFAVPTTVTGASFGLSGNFSAPDWNTAGVRYKNAAATITDTTSTGTVATAYTDLFGGNTIAASSATTFTNYFGSYFKAPISGASVTITNGWALGADSAKISDLSEASGGGATLGSPTGGNEGAGTLNAQGGVYKQGVAYSLAAGNGATLNAQPSNPTSTTSTTGVMAGVGGTCKITPLYSSRVFVAISMFGTNNTNGDGWEALIRYGTGTAPANGVAPTGTVLTGSYGAIGLAANINNSITINGIATGLIPGTAYWIDLVQSSVTGGTTQLANLTCIAYEM